MKTKKALFASCFGCVSSVKCDGEPTAVDHPIATKKRQKFSLKTRTKPDPPQSGAASKPHFEPPAHDPESTLRSAVGAEKGNESPSSHFRNTPSVASASETEDVFEDNSKKTNPTPLTPLTLAPVIVASEVKTRESTRAAYLENRLNKSDVTNDTSAELRAAETLDRRRRIQTERESRVSCHPVLIRQESFMSSSSSDEEETNDEEHASDYE